MVISGLRILLLATAISLPSVSEAADVLLAAKLEARLTATWQGQELRTVLDRLASSQGVPIWLDRRVDPQQQVNAQFTDVSLRRYSMRL